MDFGLRKKNIYRERETDRQTETEGVLCLRKIFVIFFVGFGEF